MSKPLTFQNIRLALMKIEATTPKVVCNPADRRVVEARLRTYGHNYLIHEVEACPVGKFYVIKPEQKTAKLLEGL